MNEEAPWQVDLEEETEALILEGNMHSQELYKKDKYSGLLIARLTTRLERVSVDNERLHKKHKRRERKEKVKKFRVSQHTVEREEGV